MNYMLLRLCLVSERNEEFIDFIMMFDFLFFFCVNLFSGTRIAPIFMYVR